MRYHIDTIPVWDAMKKDCECPLCVLRTKTEAQDTDRFLGGSVMEPDMRVRVNEKGFCPHHQRLLYDKQNRLGHALMILSHMDESKKRAAQCFDEALKAAKQSADTPSIKRLIKDKGKEALTESAEELSLFTSSCILCDSIRENMARYIYTFVYLWKTDDTFKRAFRESKGVCLPDAELLLQTAAEELSGQALVDFVTDVQTTSLASLDRVQRELDWFTQKFDYRNADKPWNNSKDALERAVTRLRGACIGNVCDEKK